MARANRNQPSDRHPPAQTTPIATAKHTLPAAPPPQLHHKYYESPARCPHPYDSSCPPHHVLAHSHLHQPPPPTSYSHLHPLPLRRTVRSLHPPSYPNFQHRSQHISMRGQPCPGLFRRKTR